MHTSAFTSLAIFAATVIQLVPGSIASWEPGMGAQVNSYNDVVCTQYNGESHAWWTKSPFVGTAIAPSKAECMTLNIPGSSQSLNPTNFWLYSSINEPPRANGLCTFFDALGCKGNSVGSTGPCIPARSRDGWLWKSAKCLVV
jgi:hypothetical protein